MDSAHRRGDIQGLRAVAVLLVVAFHAGLPVHGGFVGVDSFFVISGFVITGMLYREWTAAGRLSFGRFYIRRFKRLVPGLSAVVAFAVAGASLLLSPLGPQELVAKTGAGALAFVANWVIASTTGHYFDPPANANPLLHTWSLSVEEQFYLVFPAVLAIGWTIARRAPRWRHAAWLVVLLVTVLSFGAAIFGAGSSAHSWLLGFYSPLTRAWEFGVGSLLALAVARRRLRSPLAALVASAAGAELLVLSVLVISPSTPFPSAWTLAPVAGTALLILGGTNARSSLTRLLATRPLVAIGDRSYSLYLWHWPLIVFATALWPATPHVRAYAAAASILPSVLSFRLVEQPFRTLRGSPARRLALLAAAVLSFPFVVDGAMAATVTGVWTPDYRPTEMRVAHRGAIGERPFFTYLRSHFHPCALRDLRAHAPRYDGAVRCAQSRPGSHYSVAVIGDSHAEHLFIGLAERLPNQNVLYDFVNATPSLDDADFARVVRDVRARPGIRTVVLGAWWSYRGSTSTQLVPILKTLRRAGKRVFVVDGVPAFPFDVFSCKYHKAVFLGSTCSIPAQTFLDQNRSYVSQVVTAVDTVPGVHLLRITGSLCGRGRCGMLNGGQVLYRDDNHLNVAGSKFVAGVMLHDPAFAASVR